MLLTYTHKHLQVIYEEYRMSEIESNYNAIKYFITTSELYVHMVYYECYKI